MIKNVDVHWDVVSGVSIGAINAATISMFKVGEEAKASEFLLNLWRNIQAKDLY